MLLQAENIQIMVSMGYLQTKRKRNCNYLVCTDVNEIIEETWGTIKMIATLPKDTTEDKAKKIVLDRLAEYKAQKEGL